MLAKELITILEENNSDYSRQTLLQEIEYVQRIIFRAANMVSLVVDPLTGLDPKITPVDLVHVIDDAQKIDRVYKSCYDIPFNLTIEGNTIYFQENMVGKEYFVRYYKKPPKLTSESMELMVPDQYIDVLEDGVELRLESKEHGSKDNWRYWKKNDLPRLQRNLNNNYRWGKLNGSKKSESYK